MIIFGTGHRPEDSQYSFEQMIEFSTEILTKQTVYMVLTGMAAGFDLAFALAAINLDIDVWAVFPWSGHKARVNDAHIYEQIEMVSVRRTTLNGSARYPGPWIYHARNEFMVDNSDAGIAFWSGKKSGGTFACLQYAKKKGKPVTNIYPGGPDASLG